MPKKKSEKLQKLRDNLYCKHCGIKYEVSSKKGFDYLRKSKFCSKKCFGDSGLRAKTQFKKGHKDYSKKGEESSSWKGDNVGYSALHKWIRKYYGRAYKCEKCGTKTSKKYEWSSIEHKYLRDINYWQQLCSKCHRKYDNLLSAKKAGIR